METKNVMIVGVGGQGSLLASKLLGRGIHRISDLLPTHRRRINLKPLSDPTLLHQILQNKLAHRTAANIAMANK